MVTIYRSEYEALKDARDTVNYISGVLGEKKATTKTYMGIKLDLIIRRVALFQKGRSV
jgi:hypothetical protein